MSFKRLFLLAVSCLPLLLAAAVQSQIKGERAVLDNGIIRAEFSASGAKLVRFTAFRNGKNLTASSNDGKGGALKDFFAPKDFTLNNAEFTMTKRQLPDGSAELEFSTPALGGDWNFVSLVKTIRLAPGSSRLDIRLLLRNKQERMAPWFFTYWSHNFFGVPGEENLFIYAGEQGIRAAVPSFRNNTRAAKPVTDFTRGFAAMVGKKSRLGVVILPDFKETEQIYSWYCKSTNALDTMEFRYLQEKLDNGSSITKTFSVAAVSLLEGLSGAGKTGAGYLKNTATGVELQLTGFDTVSEKFQLYIDGRKAGSFTAALAPGKLFKRSLGKTGSHFRAVSKNFDLELKRDAQGKRLPLALKPERAKRAAAVSEMDAQWQFDPKEDFVTPHFVWQTGGKAADILFLLPTNGTRDIIELKQRFKINMTAPTVFPNNWHMSWRTVTDMHRPENGLNKLGPYLKRKYDVVVIGANAGVYGARHGAGSWSSYPEALRKRFLQMARQGAGLVIINAGKKDPLLKNISAKFTDGKKDLARKFSLAAAPGFEKALIKTGSYGKGKITLIDFAQDAFIVPHPGYRGSLWSRPRPEHRSHEYQFALIGHLLLQSCGQNAALTGVAGKNGQLEITSRKSLKGRMEIFDRFTNSFHSIPLTLKAGKNAVALPALRHGRNYVHVTAADGSFGFAVIEHQAPDFIRNITLSNDGKSIRGRVQTSRPLKGKDTVQIRVIDNLDRVLYCRSSQDGRFQFAPPVISTNRHILSARLLQNGKVTAESRKEFYLPRLRNTIANYTNMLWLCGDAYPEYSYFYRYKQYSAFGFNFHYSGSGNNGMLNFIRYSDAECGSNGHGCTQIFYYSGLHESLKKYSRTHDKKDLIRGRCPNDPRYKEMLSSDKLSEKMAAYATQKVFQLGDEMSMTFHTAGFDICMCPYCMKDFRAILKKQYGTLAKLNAAWDCTFKSWEEVLPLTLQEAMFKDKRAGYVAHRLYMDEVFRRTLNGYRERLQKKYPGAVVGPTGVNGLPSPYGGNFNFYSMKDFDCGSFYRDTRLPVSFNRDRRLVMRYRGYSETEPDTVYSFWEGLALGERGNNNWCGPTFLLPDLRFSLVRGYYSRLLWELRRGAGDLLYHSRKITDTAAILHSQRSLIINYTKQRKTEFYPKELSFARLLEDLGVPHRFIATEELDELNSFKVLFLPESSVLSDADAAKITAFVKNGGILIADVEPGTFDGLGNKRQKPVLDDVFGVNSVNTSLRKVKGTPVKELKITHAGRGVKAVGAKSSGSAKLAFGKAPLFLEHTFGKGRTLLLNFVCDYAALRKTPGAKAFALRIARFMAPCPLPGKVESSRPVMHGAFADGDNRYFVLLPERLEKEKFNTPFTAPFVLEKASHLYDVRQGKYLGYGSRFNVTLHAGNGTLLAALPERPGPLTLTAPAKIKAGSAFTLSAKTGTSGRNARHVLHLSCTAPGGKEMKVFEQIAKTTHGTHTFTHQSACNDPKGIWRFTLRDSASGLQKEISVLFE